MVNILKLNAVHIFITGIFVFCLVNKESFCEASNDGFIGISFPPDFRAFNDKSPWNVQIPKDPQIDPNSSRMIQHLLSKTNSIKGSFREWTIPAFVIDSAKSPLMDVVTSAKELNPNVDPNGNGVAEGLPMPKGIWSDPQRDGHMVLVDIKLRRSWDFSRARQQPDGSWTASRIDIWDLDGPGFREPFPPGKWWTFGATGSGMPLFPGIIRPEEIESGEIRHALLFASPINRKSSAPGGGIELCSPPASRSDGQGIGIEFIPEGAHLQLDPDLDVDALPVSRATKVVARAMQKYGMYNGISSRDFKIFFQNLGPDGGKWKQYGDMKDLSKIPIDKFRVLKCSIVTKN